MKREKSFINNLLPKFIIDLDSLDNTEIELLRNYNEISPDYPRLVILDHIAQRILTEYISQYSAPCEAS